MGHWRIWLARNTGSVEVIGSSPICSTNTILNPLIISGFFFYTAPVFPLPRPSHSLYFNNQLYF